MSKMERAGRGKSGRAFKTRSPQPVGAALAQLIDGLGIAQTLKQHDVLTLWNSIVGERIARVTTAQRIERGVLYVHVSTAPWRAELTMKRVEIIQKINKTLGRTIVTDIRFR
jgi:predicted nucleic acid-binding Zn ribbon protein